MMLTAATLNIEAPTPAIYRGVQPEDYHAIKAFSNSLAGHMLRSAAHGRHYLDNPPESSDSMRLGSAVDAIVFGNESAIAVAPKCDRRTKDGKALWQSFVDGSAGKTMVDADEWAAAQAMAKSVREHPAAKSILDRLSKDDTQVAVIWRDEETGVMCKGLLDILLASMGLLADLKTSKDASPREFPKSIFNFGYCRQGAMYADGLARNGIGIDNFAWIAVENSAPYCAAVYRLRDEDLQRGFVQYRAAIKLYAECMKTGIWPGYSQNIQDISLPAWAAKQIDEGFSL